MTIEIAIVVFAVLIGAIGLGILGVALVRTMPVRRRLVDLPVAEVDERLRSAFLPATIGVDMAGSNLPRFWLGPEATEMLRDKLRTRGAFRLRMLASVATFSGDRPQPWTELAREFGARAEMRLAPDPVQDFMLVDRGWLLILLKKHFLGDADDERTTLVIHERPYFAGRRFERYFEHLWARSKRFEPTD